MSDTALRIMAIGLGGAVGAIARYGVGVACAAAWGQRFGHGTLVVNVVGCFALGLLMHEAMLNGSRVSPHVHGGLAIGLLGGLTTFSTFGYQTIRHLEAGEPLLAAANVGLNVVLGLAAAAAGMAVARVVWPAA